MLPCSPGVAAWTWEWLTDISRPSSRPRCSECDTYPSEMVGNKTGIWMPGCPRLNTLKQMQSFAYWKDKKGFFFSSESCLFFTMYWHQNGKCLFLNLVIYKQELLLLLLRLLMQGARGTCKVFLSLPWIQSKTFCIEGKKMEPDYDIQWTNTSE